MSAPSWRRLVADLTARGVQSPYLERLRARLDPAAALDDLEREIVREMASALGRAEDKVNLALLELDLAGRALQEANEPPPARPRTGTEAGTRTDTRADGGVPAPTRRECAQRFNELRRLALRARHELQIHREAVGMRRNRILEELYPIPQAATEDEE